MRFFTYDRLDTSSHADAFARVREAIERDDFRAIDVKKLSPMPYYRAKIGYADRLLLQFIAYGGETACVALEIIEHHAYDRSRFLRGARVDESKIEAEAVAAAAGVDRTPIAFLHPTRGTLAILDKPHSFDDAQEAVLGAPCPLLLVGSAGSGKTVLSLEKMRGLRGVVAYVTRSAFLAERARSVYFAHGWESALQKAQFWSFREVLESVRVPAGRPALFGDFAAWFARNREATRGLSAHQAFEEIRGVLTAAPSGPLAREAYLALGPRQSIYLEGDRARLYDLFEKYRAFLNEAELYDPNLVAHAHLTLALPRFDFLVVDEVQDLTPVELTLLLKLQTGGGQFIVAGDANQIVHPSFFSWSAVKTLLLRDASLADRQTLTILDVSYRNAPAITTLANALLTVKQARFGSIDRESNMLMRPAAGASPGEVVGVPSGSPAEKELDQNTRRSIRTAVIVLHDEDKAEARARFATPLVFSVHEAKGLEYENVVLFEIVSRARAAYREVSEGVTAEDVAATELAYRRPKDKDDKSLELYKFFVNALYVAMTRATTRLYLVESDLDHPLLALLGVRFGNAAPAIQRAESTIEEWQREARKLELQGDAEQVEAIRRDVLRPETVPWSVLDRAGYRELADRALAPGCVSAKAKQQLFEYACFHGDAGLACRLADAAGFPAANGYPQQRHAVVRRHFEPYEAKNTKEVLRDTERYGIDFRSVMNQTPLMLAARAGNVRLVEALLARGARADLADHFGKTPAVAALSRAYQDMAYACGPFGALWELLAPPSVDVLVDQRGVSVRGPLEGRLLKIVRQDLEHFVLHATLALSKQVFGAGATPRPVGALLVASGQFCNLPESVVRPAWLNPDAIEAVLARGRLGSGDPSSSGLWLPIEGGGYIPNESAEVRVATAGGAPSAFTRIRDLLGLDLVAEHVAWVRPFADSRPAALGKAGPGFVFIVEYPEHAEVLFDGFRALEELPTAVTPSNARAYAREVSGIVEAVISMALRLQGREKEARLDVGKPDPARWLGAMEEKARINLPCAQNISRTSTASGFGAVVAGAQDRNLGIDDLAAALNVAQVVSGADDAGSMHGPRLAQSVEALRAWAARLRGWLWAHTAFYGDEGFVVQMDLHGTTSFAGHLRRAPAE